MRHTSLVTILVFVLGLGIGYLARGTVHTLQQRHVHATDLAAIEKLHQDDIAATRAQDRKGLLDIWSEDAVRFTPGGPPTAGKQAIEAENDKARAQFPNFRVLSYDAKYKSIDIEDGLACEWGEHDVEFKPTPEGPSASWHGEGFHVLKRQPDGSWKFAVLITNQ